MLSIITLYNSNNNYSDIYNYINHIDNININKFDIEILIINCDEEINNLNFNFANNSNIKAHIYNYNIDYNDSIYNDIINNVSYEKILFTNLNTYITDTIIDWVSNNDIDDECFIKTNTFCLNNISDKFFYNYDNSIYNDIIENVSSLYNEYGNHTIDKETFIDIFNNNKNIFLLEKNMIQKDNTYFMSRTRDFLLINKKLVQKTGFMISNIDPNKTFQYLILGLINNNFKMLKLPYITSAYILNTETEYNYIDLNTIFDLNTDFNKFTNYKTYDVINNKSNIIIRNQVKTIKGYNTAHTVSENQNLKNKIIDLNNTINNLKKNNQINTKKNNHDEYDILNNQYLNLKDKYEQIEEKFNNLNFSHSELLNKYDDLLIKHKQTKDNILLKLYDIINFEIDN